MFGECKGYYKKYIELKINFKLLAQFIVAMEATLFSAVLLASNTLESVTWQLVELNGATLEPLEAGKQPSVLFDAAKKSIAGYNGCNNYFGQYELKAQSLKFGPIASTRRACPGVQSNIETKFMAVLENTRAWEIKDSVLTFSNDRNILARFAINKANDTAPDLNSLTIRSTVYKEKPVKLLNGEYRAPAAPGAASEIVVKLTDKRVFGKIDAKNVGAVVFTTSTGGMSTFYELALLIRESGGWVNSDAKLLGDRQKVSSVTIDANHIVIDMVTHGPKDPQCCPTQQVKKRFTVQGDRLIAAAENTAGKQQQLVGPVWRWLHSRYNNDTQAKPDKSDNYTVQFLGNGEVNIKADCNLKGGTYKIDDKRLSIAIVRTTAAACTPNSLEEGFKRDLSAAAIYFFKDNELYIDLKYDSGTMKFVNKY